MASDSQKSKAQTFFQYGNDAAMKNNHVYAIQMYREACKLDPENLIFRQALRGIERRKFGNDPAKVGRLVGARIQPIRLKAKASKGKNWAHVLELCEEAFIHNPWDVGVARDAAEAAEHLDYKLLAQWLVESVQAQATDADFFRFAAHIQELNKSWHKAIQCWERVKKINPNDEMANRKINALSADATIQRAGLDDAVDERMRVKPAAGTDPAEIEEMRRQKLSPEERFRKEIQENPGRIGPYLGLADHYKMRGQLDEAEKVLARGLKANPKDETLQQTHAEVQISRLQRAIEAWSRRCRERPGDETAKAKLDQLNGMLNDYEIKEFRRRLAINAEDQGLQLQLGLRLAKAGKHDEAIAAFQQARGNPALRVQALHQAGLSFEATGVWKLAERSYQDALKAADPADLNTLNALHYRLGRVAESQGNTQIAEEHYNEVAANDYAFFDVAQRLKNLGA